jgi:hypothetical protein
LEFTSLWLGVLGRHYLSSALLFEFKCVFLITVFIYQLPAV